MRTWVDMAFICGSRARMNFLSPGIFITPIDVIQAAQIRAMKKIIFLIVCAAAVWAWIHYCGAKTYAPGVLVEKDPVQVMAKEPTIRVGDFTLKTLATYDIEARVLHTKRYYVGPGSSLAPYDVAVGWGPMSDQTVIDKLSLSQGNRFYFYEWFSHPPIPLAQIICHSANMHLIPSTYTVRITIAWLRAGDLVRMRGRLIEASCPGMKPWRSSLSRTDTGNGACELMYVESIEKL